MSQASSILNAPFFRELPRRALAPLPAPLLQPVLQRIVRAVAARKPELFSRLGGHSTKTFIIDPLNLPFIFLLSPDPVAPRLRAIRRGRAVQGDCRIAGSFLNLLDMVDGRLDGDALFFSRDLIIEGDTEAVVVLRNALDDLDSRMPDEIAAALGRPATIALKALRRLRAGSR